LLLFYSEAENINFRLLTGGSYPGLSDAKTPDIFQVIKNAFICWLYVLIVALFAAASGIRLCLSNM
ncbi:hypothetical protein Q4R45_20710, partial [Morganella morganii subsp. sibonii]